MKEINSLIGESMYKYVSAIPVQKDEFFLSDQTVGGR